MKPWVSRLSQTFAFSALLFNAHFAFAQQSIFTGLESDEIQIRQTIEQYSSKIETNAGAPEIPSSAAYRIFVGELLGDPDRGFDIPAPDARILSELRDASTSELAAEHYATLTKLCTDLNNSDSSATEIISLATRFEESRLQSERDLDVRFAEAMDRLTPETAQNIGLRWDEFSANQTVIYTSFDMPGFAREMPDAAHRILLAGCERFQSMTYAR